MDPWISFTVLVISMLVQGNNFYIRSQDQIDQSSSLSPLFHLLEVQQFQNRLNRSMMECQDKAKDMMYPGIENDAKKMGKVEDALLSCMSQTVDSHIGLLKPMKQRIESQLKSL